MWCLRARRWGNRIRHSGQVLALIRRAEEEDIKTEGRHKKGFYISRFFLFLDGLIGTRPRSCKIVSNCLPTMEDVNGHMITWGIFLSLSKTFMKNRTIYSVKTRQFFIFYGSGFLSLWTICFDFVVLKTLFGKFPKISDGAKFGGNLLPVPWT